MPGNPGEDQLSRALSQGNAQLRPIVLVLGNWEATLLGDWDATINSPEARGYNRRAFLDQLQRL
jgi:hypothetical protein